MFEELKEIICEYMGVAPETIKEDSRPIEDLGFDSYGFMSVVGKTEERFNTEVEERGVVNVKAMKGAVDYIQSLQAEQVERREEDMATETLRDVIQHGAEAYREQTAFQYKVKKGIIDKLYNEMNLGFMTVNHAAEALEMKGRHIVVIDAISYQWITAYFGIVDSGSVTVPINARFPAEVVCELLNRTDMEMLVYDELCPDVAGDVREKCLSIKYMISMQTQETAGDVFSLSRLIIENMDTYKTELPGSQLYIILFTSGTTGRSKEIVLNHRNLTGNVICLDMGILAGTASATLLPINHIYYLTMDIIKGLCIGMIIRINDSIVHVQCNTKLFEPEIVLLVLLIIESIHGKLRDVGSLILKKMVAKVTFGGNLRTICSGGAYLNPDYVDRFREHGITILQGYGMAKCSPITSTDLEWESKEGSTGRLLPDYEIKAVNEEIWTRGSNAMQGRYKMPEQTAEILKDGWLRTGGLRYADEDNFVYIASRHKSLIILANDGDVPPEELESGLSHLELVKEVLVREKDKIIEAEVFPDYEYTGKRHIKGIRRTLQELVDGFNKDMSIYKRIYSSIVREAESEKTPSKKIKRLQNVYSMQINMSGSPFLLPGRIGSGLQNGRL